MHSRRWQTLQALRRPLSEREACVGEVCRGDAEHAADLRQRLAAEGMGDVDRAKRADGRYQQTAALKRINPARVDPRAAVRLARERQILARFARPTIARQLVVHRDLNPSKVLVDADGVPQLVGYGVGRLLKPDLARSRSGERLFTCADPVTMGGQRPTLERLLDEAMARVERELADSLVVLARRLHMLGRRRQRVSAPLVNRRRFPAVGSRRLRCMRLEHARWESSHARLVHRHDQSPSCWRSQAFAKRSSVSIVEAERSSAAAISS